MGLYIYGDLELNYRTDLFCVLFLKIVNMPTKLEDQSSIRKNVMRGKVSKQPDVSLPEFLKLTLHKKNEVSH